MSKDMTKQARQALREKRAGRWYDSGVNFRCIHPRCSDCCSGKRGPGYVWVSADDMENIATFLGISFDEFTRAYVRQVEFSFSLVEKPNHDCVFLKDGSCSVYSVRPTQCRTYPFWPEVMENRTEWLRESRDCPGIESEPSPVSGEEIQTQLDIDAAARVKCGRD